MLTPGPRSGFTKRLEVVIGFWVRTEHEAPLKPSSHQGSVRVLDDSIDFSERLLGALFQQLLVSTNCVVILIALRSVNVNHTVSHNKVISNNDSDIDLPVLTGPGSGLVYAAS